MTRVLLTADTVGGVWTYALTLARALPDVEFHMATLGLPPRSDQQADAEGMANLTVYPSAFRLEWMPDPWDDVRRSGEWLLELARQIRPDVVHLGGYAHAALPFDAPVMTVGHSCVLSWWRAVKGESAPAEWDVYAERVREGLRAAWLVVAPTEAMLGCLQAEYGPLPRTRVVYNSREPALFPSGVKQACVLSAGRLWDEAKGVGTLARAASYLPWPVLVAGDAHSPDGTTLSFPNVHALGTLAPPEMARQMVAASVYVLPARYEPFGLSLLEAALSGCALVAGDISSLREVWGDAAVFVPPGDEDALAEALSHLIADETHRVEMARRARARAGCYSPVRMAEGYRAVYTEAAG